MSENKRALVVVNYSEFMCDNTRDSMQDAARRWGCAFLEMREDTIPKWTDRAPNAMKMAAFILTDFDELCILDADTMISSLCPSPFEAFPNPEELVVVVDCSPIECRIWDIGLHTQKMPELECGLDVNTYWNSGFMVARRKHHEAMFKKATELCGVSFGSGWVDQSVANLCAKLCGVKLHYADVKWNCIQCQRPGWMNMGNYPDTFILHLAGQPGREQYLKEIQWRV